ncbi:hypothetical protein ACFZB9_08700 [Kitasatospora sp. NPDC008050]|uniref:hypothetical protein n=1 Tax=Kitasatospora sp. NPDC008050 TaxID=3364021 RepID=UPI0036EEA4FA
MFFYASAQAAQHAYQAVLTSEQNCRGQTRSEQSSFGAPTDALIVQTASVNDGASWSRHWTGVETPAGGTEPGIQTDHGYVLQRGVVLTVVDFNEGPSASASTAPYDVVGDAAVLHAIAAHLST